MANIDEINVYGSERWSKLKPLDFSKIETVDFPSTHYYKTITEKKQITLHHTVSGEGVRGDINTWLGDGKRIATCVIVDRKGIVHQCFSSKYWGHHIGVKSSFLKEQGFNDYSTRNVELNKAAIGIEIDNWGWLKKVGTNKYKTYYGNTITLEEDQVSVYEDEFRGEVYYEKYTDSQIETVGELLLLWNKSYDIPLTYNDDMWDVSKKALGGEAGVWTHVSYRDDKSDVHPQKELIEMLKTLNSIS